MKCQNQSVNLNDFSKYAPKIESLKIATDKIREVIGSGGKDDS